MEFKCIGIPVYLQLVDRLLVRWWKSMIKTEPGKMPETLKLNKQEQDDLRKKSIEINKVLINMDRAPIKESELAHIILAKSISYVKVGKSGTVIVDGLE